MPSQAHGGSQTLMAFDFGERRIGVALGNTLTGGARPLCVIEEERRDARFAQLADLIAQWQPDQLVVGLPKYPDGADHPFAARCERFANQLRGRFGLPVMMADERWTSALAPGQTAIDAEAAAIFLQSVLDTLASHAQIASA
jgi:putative holliday junction resolvase